MKILSGHSVFDCTTIIYKATESSATKRTWHKEAAKGLEFNLQYKHLDLDPPTKTRGGATHGTVGATLPSLHGNKVDLR